MRRSLLSAAVLAGILSFFASAYAVDYVITIKDNQFSPRELSIPADQKVKITVRNMDVTPAEFESYALNREKVVSANNTIILFVGPLKAGPYV